MKKLLIKYKIPIALIFFLSLPGMAAALIPCSVNQGCTGVNTITGIPFGTGIAPLSIVTIGSGLNFSAGTLTASGSGGTVTSFAFTNGAGFSGTVSNATTTPTLSLVLQNADATHSGQLTSTDWNTFNNKQAAGNYITALTGDITASGPGSAATTLATVNGNVGSFTNSSITVNAKGLVTAASSGSAPEVPLTFSAPLVRTVNTISIPVATGSVNGYLSSTDWSTFNGKGSGTVTSVSGTTNRITSTGGTTPVIDISASYVGQSSITTLGTITTGIWTGTAIANANLANSTISGKALGTNLSALTATDTTLTFSGSYTGAAARTVGLNLANANTWTGQQSFNTTAPIFGTITGSTQCLHVNTSGLISGSGSDCGSGGGMAIGGTVTSGTAGSVLYVASGPILAQDNSNFFWDSTNHRLGIGTTSPSTQLHLFSTNVAGTMGNVENTNSGGFANWRGINDVGNIGQFGIYGSTRTSYGAAATGETNFYTNTVGLTIMADNATGIIKFATGGNTETMRLDQSGNILLVGKITKYNNISTVSNGIPSEYATIDLTAQTAAKTATTIYTPTATGLYRVSVYLQVTTAGSTSSILGGSTGVVLTYNDGDGNVAQSDTVALSTTTGTIAVTSATNTTATNLEGSKVIYAKTGVAIQYAIGYTSVGVTPMQYAAHLKVEAL